MQFINPYFLFGLLAISIPIIIHLFNFRRFKKVYFTNVRYIKDIKTETQKKSRLRHLLVLLLRIMAVICLVMAFAQPFIPASKENKGVGKRKAISVYIDNSFSMEAQSNGMSLLDGAMKKAAEIAAYYSTIDLFQLLTDDFEGRYQRFVARDEFISMVDEVSLSPVTRNLSEVYRRLSDMQSQTSNDYRIIYLLSDFQKTTADLGNIFPDTTTTLYLVPLTAEKTDNLYIDSCWFETPVHLTDQRMTLKVQIKNSGETGYEKMPLKLMVNNSQKGLASFDISGDASVGISIPFTNYTAGIQYGMLEINDYPVTYDDKLYLSYTVSSSIPVLAINENDKNRYLDAVLGRDSAFVFINSPVRSLDFSAFGNYNLIILNELTSISSGLEQEMKRFVENGGSVAVFPSLEMDVQGYRESLSRIGSGYFGPGDTAGTRVTEINTDNQVYNDVFESIPENIDLPVVKYYFPVEMLPRSGQEPLLTLQNGRIFLSVQPVGKGFIYLCAVPLEPACSNFPLHAIFVPTIYKIALLSEPPSRLFYTIGSDEPVEIRKTELEGDMTFKVRSTTGDFEVIPEHRIIGSRASLYMHGQVTEAGNYTLLTSDQVISGLSFNYDRKESNLNSYTPEELKKSWDPVKYNFKVIQETGKPFGEVLDELNIGIKLWRWFVVLALLCLAGEVVVLRYF
jgi:hypothetical protein